MGDPAVGFCNACIMSLIPARMRSLEDARGIETLVGNQVRVSQTRVFRVSHIQTA